MPIAFSVQDWFNFATVVALASGLWACFNWWHQQRLRREEEVLRKQKEDPGIEVGFACRQDPLPDGRVLMTIDYPIRNTGVLPIYPNIKEASFRIGQIPLASTTGFLTRNVPVNAEVEIPCAPHRKGLRLEPKTETVFTVQYLATPGHLYAVAFTLPSQSLTKDGEPWKWGRWRAIFVPKPRAIEIQDERPLSEANQS
jgi:hypothetical protein